MEYSTRHYWLKRLRESQRYQSSTLGKVSGKQYVLKVTMLINLCAAVTSFASSKKKMVQGYMFGLINSKVKSKVCSCLNELRFNCLFIFIRLVFLRRNGIKQIFLKSIINHRLSIYCSKFSDFFYYNSLRFCLIKQGDYCFQFQGLNQCLEKEQESYIPNFFDIQLQKLKKCSKTIRHKIPGNPLRTHYPNNPIYGACITFWQILFSILTISKKLSTIATPILEKLTVANISEAPSLYFQQSPQRLASFSLNRAQFDIQMIKPITRNTKILITCRLSKRRRQPRRDEPFVRNTWFQLMRSMRQKIPIMIATILLNLGLILQYQISWKWFVLLATDCSLQLLSRAFFMSQQKTACFIQSLSPFYCRLHLAIALFINLLCQIEDSIEMGQVSRYPMLFKTTSKFDLHIATRLAGIIAQEASQYLRISGYLLFLRTYFIYAATILKSFLALSTYSYIYPTLWYRQAKQSHG